MGSFADGVDAVYADSGRGTDLAIDELIGTGHRRICLLNCSSRLPSHNQRLESYRSKLETNVMAFSPDWNIQSMSNNGNAA